MQPNEDPSRMDGTSFFLPSSLRLSDEQLLPTSESSIQESDALSQHISSGIIDSPFYRALLLLIVPLCWCIFPLLLPLSGSFDSTSSKVDFFIYAFIWEPLYFYLSFWVVLSFFLFSTRRFENQKLYFFLSLISFGSTIIYCLAKGSHGLHGDTVITLYSNIWTDAFVVVTQFFAAVYWHFYFPTSSSSRPVQLADESALKSETHVSLTQVDVKSSSDLHNDSSCTTVYQKFDDSASQHEESHVIQFFLALFSCMILVLAFNFCQIILAYFNARPSDGSRTGIYILFQVVMFVLRLLASQLAECQCKRSPLANKDIASLFLFSQHCFFFVFYRSLFAHISSIGEFALFQILQMGFELVQYVLMLQYNVFRVYHQLSRRTINGCYHKFHGCLSACGLVAELSEDNYVESIREISGSGIDKAWNKAVTSKSGDFLVRLIAMTATWICYVTVSLMINLLPWLQPHFPLLVNKSGTTRFATQQVYFVVSIVCEWTVAFVINWFLSQHRRRGESLWQMWSVLSRNTEMLLLFMVILAHIVQDMYVPSLCMNFDSNLPLPCG